MGVRPADRRRSASASCSSASARRTWAGLGDIFNGIRGGGGNPSVDKPLKATQKNPKDAKAWKDLATAYDPKGDYRSRSRPGRPYTQLRPKDADGLTRARDRLRAAVPDADAATAQNAQTERAERPDARTSGRRRPRRSAARSAASPTRSAQAVEHGSASTRFNDALSAPPADGDAARRRLPEAREAPAGRARPSQLQLAQAAETAGDAPAAIAAYKRFLKLAPDDPNAPQAKAQIKALQTQLARRVVLAAGLDSARTGDNAFPYRELEGDDVNFDIKTEQLDGDGVRDLARRRGRPLHRAGVQGPAARRDRQGREARDRRLHGHDVHRLDDARRARRRGEAPADERRRAVARVQRPQHHEDLRDHRSRPRLHHLPDARGGDRADRRLQLTA